MNLTNDPWIPAVYQDGRHEWVSLRQIFSEGESICDIEVRPQDRISLMRLFLCVAQGSVKNWPESMKEYRSIDIYKYREMAIQYLDERIHVFNLFDPERPFLQIPDIENFSKKDKSTPLSKLDLCLATGNNPTVFDNLALDPSRQFSSPTIALNLLTFQCMSPPGLSSQVKWKGEGTPKSTQGSPLLKAWHAYIQRENILKTIYSNCIPQEVMSECRNREKFKWGVPVWDRFPTSMQDTEAWNNAQNTYLGRLVFLSSLIKIDKKNNRMIWGKPFAKEGQLTINSRFREPSIPYILKKNNKEYSPLLIDLTKGAWRDLPSILQCSSLKAIEATLSISIEMAKKIGKFCLWTGGLKNGDLGKSAKIEGSIESYFYLPEEIFDIHRQNVYSKGVELADAICGCLKKAVKQYLTIIYSSKKDGLPKKFQSEIEKRTQNIVLVFYEKAQVRLDLLFDLVKNLDKKTSKDTLSWSSYLKTMHKRLFFITCKPKSPRQYLAHEYARKLLYKEEKNG